MNVTDLRETISMAANDGNIAWFGVLVINWSILFNRELKLVVLVVCGRSGVFANVRGGERVLFYSER